MVPDLDLYVAEGGEVTSPGPGRWRLLIPQGEERVYRLAQLDDYAGRRSRRAFPHRPPLRLSLRARASAPDLRGTWGFGFWNDPFGFSLTVRGSGRRLPTLPDAVWFFHASPPNHLAFRDTHPARGFLAAAFASRPVPTALLLLAAPLAAGLLLPAAARLLRRLARSLIEEDAAIVRIDPTLWHTYELLWLPERASFSVDETTVFETPVSPTGPLGLVLWLDNQYASLPASGRLSFGSLATPEDAYLELADVELGGA
ncbi:MAG: hypothetical protein HPY83_02380 [Anaerolineae bacterium]|nr:hypothetical protein [Anaerolineae bacterium]